MCLCTWVNNRNGLVCVLVIPVLCVEAIKAGLCHVTRELGLLFFVMHYTIDSCLFVYNYKKSLAT